VGAYPEGASPYGLLDMAGNAVPIAASCECCVGARGSMTRTSCAVPIAAGSTPSPGITTWASVALGVLNKPTVPCPLPSAN
jgi:hypothetical protein